jgi:hypothetical protein
MKLNCRSSALMTIPSSAVSKLALLALLLAMPAFAHPPFGSSVSARLLPDHLEIFVTTGNEAARQFLKDVPPETHRPAAPDEPYWLPTELAARFFEVTADGKAMSAERVELRLDGMDYEFGLIYPRATGTRLNLRAVYLEAIGSSSSTPLVVSDETGTPFASALLSRGQNEIAVTLPVAAVPAAAPRLTPTFGEYLKLGITHILTGYDHLLFLGALLLGCRRLGPMLGVITCFTAAHSLTLGLAALNVLTISGRIIEPLIAASIVCVALENFRRGHSTAGRCALAFGFGLIHGFGFASALRETGLGSSGWSLVKPLFSFNLGVECGQLAVAAMILPLLFWLRRWPFFARHGTAAISVVIILVAGYWLMERTFLT